MYHGIGFDLRLDIPHKYVVECFRMALNMKPNGADALVTNGTKPSECARYFLRYCLLSQLCVDERFDGRSLAAAAVDYALTATRLKSHKNYNPQWLDRMNNMPSAVGCKVLSRSLIEEIQEERKSIKPKIDACIDTTKHVSPIPYEEDSRGEKREHVHTEENTKRARMRSPIVESIGQKDHSTHSPPPIQLSSHSAHSPPPGRLPSQSTHSVSITHSTHSVPSTQPTYSVPSTHSTYSVPSTHSTYSVPSTQSSYSVPITQPILYHASTEPSPLISTESTSNDPPPLFSTQASTQSLPAIALASTESVDSPAPLFVSQSGSQEQEDVPLFSF